jgi:hypothetical protein
MSDVKTVTLSRPLGDLAVVELREPKAGELRGLKIADVVQLDTTTMVTLIPRISNLSARDVENLGASDLTKVMTETLGFFVDSSPSA